MSHRDTLRELGGGKNLASPFNEGFSFTPEEFELLKQNNPALFDEDPQRKHKAWIAWAQTSEGQAFRIR